MNYYPLFDCWVMLEKKGIKILNWLYFFYYLSFQNLRKHAFVLGQPKPHKR